MPTIKVNKGGCKVGKKEDKGGCKEGLKAPPVTGRLATKKTKVQGPPQQAKVVAAKPRVAKVAKVMPAKAPKIMYPVKKYSIRGDEYAVHKGKVYKYITYIGDRTGHINIAEPDIKDMSIINEIKKINPTEVLVRDKMPKGKFVKISVGEGKSATPMSATFNVTTGELKMKDHYRTQKELGEWKGEKIFKLKRELNYFVGHGFTVGDLGNGAEDGHGHNQVPFLKSIGEKYYGHYSATGKIDPYIRKFLKPLGSFYKPPAPAKKWPTVVSPTEKKK